MPTARELLAQADALMRRNRAELPPPVAVDVPELTDALPPDRSPVVDLHAPPAALDDVPELTDAVEEIEAPSILEMPGADDEPSRWLEIDRGEVSITGPAPDSIVVVPGLRGAAPAVRGLVGAPTAAAPPPASLADAVATPTDPAATPTDAAATSTDAAAADADAVVEAAPDVGIERAPEPPAVPPPDAPDVAPAPEFDVAAFAAAIGIDATAPAFAAPATPATPEAAPVSPPPATVQWKDDALDAMPDAAPAVEDALLRDGEGMVPAVADAAIDIADVAALDVAIDIADVAALDVAAVAAPDLAVADLTPPPVAAADVAAPEYAAPEFAAPEFAAPEFAAPAPLATPESAAAAAPMDPARWVALAEEIRMQVLQRIDIFTDTGLQAQLAARLQPIVDRASADLVATINRQVGQLLRAYVAEAIEREIDQWRRGG